MACRNFHHACPNNAAHKETFVLQKRPMFLSKLRERTCRAHAVPRNFKNSMNRAHTRYKLASVTTNHWVPCSLRAPLAGCCRGAPKRAAQEQKVWVAHDR